MKSVILDKKTEEMMQDLHCDILTTQKSFRLLVYCLENDIYADTRVELYSFMYVLDNYIAKLKADYARIEDILGIEQ